MNFTRKLSAASAIAALAFTFATAAPAARADDLRTVARGIAAKSSKAVVTIKLIIKMKVMGQENEDKIEVTGTTIDPSGLTVISASGIDPSPMIRAFLASMGRHDVDIECDVKETAIIMDDGSEVDADVVLKDADLDLAFIKPRDTTQKFDAIPLKPRGKAPQMLEDVFVLSRLGRIENRSPSLSLGYVKAIVKGPRTFYICDDETALKSLGCIAFDAAGAPLGVFVTKHSAEGGESQMGAMMGMMMGRQKNAAATAILRSVEDVLEIAEQAKAAKVPEKKKAEEPASKKDEAGDKGSDKADKGDKATGGDKKPADGPKKDDKKAPGEK